MSIGTLSIDLEARLAKFEAGMDKAARLTEQQSARMDAAIARSKSVAMAGGAAIIGVLSVTAIAQFARATVDAVDALNDVKDATGASIENISALELVAMNAGGTLDDVSSILVKFNGVLKEANDENGVGQALKAIGLNAEELKRLDPAEALRQTAVALSKFSDDGNKARITQELFGKSVKEAAPFLNELAQQTALVGNTTKEQAEQAEKFNKALFRMEANASLLGRSLVMKLVPALDELFERFARDGVGTTVVEKLKERLGVDDLSQLELATKANSARIARVVGEMTRLSEVVKQNPNAMLEATVGPNGNAAMLASERIKQLRGEYDQLQRSAAKLRGSLGDKADARGGASRVLVGPVMPDDMRPSVPDLPAASGASGVAKIRVPRAPRTTRVREVDPDAAYRASLLERLTDEWEAVGDASRAASIELDRYVERLAEDKGRADMAALDRATALFEATMTPAEKLKVVLAEVNALYAQGAILSDQWGTAEEKRDRIIAAAKATMDGQRDSMNELSDAAKSFADTMLRAMENGDDLGDALERIAAKKLVFDPLSKAIDGLFDSLAKGASVGGSSASGGAGAGGPNLMDFALRAAMMIFGGGFADGGTPPLGKVSLVGERGPELFVPKQLGTIIPNHMLGGGGGAAPQVTVINHVTAGAQIGHSDLAAAMAVTKQQTEASIIRTLRGRGVPV
jgi:hypothetical protein